MINHARGNRDQALPLLREVASSEAIELVEVAIARDLVAELTNQRLVVELPQNVRVP
jgi:hypothetical protein